MSVLAVRERFCPSSLARGEPREDIPRPLLLPQPPAGTSRQGSTLVQPRGSIESTEQGKEECRARLEGLKEIPS